MKKLFFIPILFCGFLANAQDFADTSVENANVSTIANHGKLTFTADIKSNQAGNNASHQVKIIVLLPEAKLHSYKVTDEFGRLLHSPLGCKAMRYNLGIHPYGYLICSVGDIQRSEATVSNRTVKLTVVTEVPLPEISHNFSVMVYNLIPDKDMTNNFRIGQVID